MLRTVLVLTVLVNAAHSLMCHVYGDVNGEVVRNYSTIPCSGAHTKFCFKYMMTGTDERGKAYTAVLRRGCANETNEGAACKSTGHAYHDDAKTIGGRPGAEDLYCCSKDACNSSQRTGIFMSVTVLLSLFLSSE